MLRFAMLFCLIGLMLPMAQGQITQPPSGGNQRAAVTQYMGLAAVTITYNSPDVTAANGNSREGNIWGQLVPYGLSPNTFGTATEIPWRAGANENTVFTTTHNIEVQGEPLPAGSYGLHMIPQKTGPWTLIFNKETEAWGSYFYDPAADVLRVEVSPEETTYHEWLTFEFEKRQLASCEAALIWEKLRIPFALSVPNTHALYVAQIKSDLASSTGFSWQAWNNAANFCLNQNYALEQGLAWAEHAVSGPFVGQANFTTLTTKASLLMALEREAEGLAIMKQAAQASGASVQQLHQLGRQLIGLDKKDLALEIFQLNAERHPNTWPVNVGLARGYSALGDYKKALKHAKLAQANVPEGDTLNQGSLANMVEQLQKNEDVN